ncbi:hypothetical protein BGZ82_003047, partial [Podila clonocystis]
MSGNMSAVLTDFSSITGTLRVTGELAKTSRHGPDMARDGMRVGGLWYLNYRHGNGSLCRCGTAMRSSWNRSTAGQFGEAEYLETSGAMQACWERDCIYLGHTPFTETWTPPNVPVAVGDFRGTAAEGVSNIAISVHGQKTLAERVAALNDVEEAFQLYDLRTGKLVPENDLKRLALSNFQGPAGYTAVSHTWGR